MILPRFGGHRDYAANACPGGFEMRVGFWRWSWPAAVSRTLLARALAQLDLVAQMVAADPTLRIVRTREDLQAAHTSGDLSLLLTMEGGEALVDDPTRVRQFYAADKNSEATKDPNAALMCYFVTISPGTPQAQTPDQVLALNQFGFDRYRVSGPRELCVPSVVLSP